MESIPKFYDNQFCDILVTSEDLTFSYVFTKTTLKKIVTTTENITQTFVVSSCSVKNVDCLYLLPALN